MIPSPSKIGVEEIIVNLVRWLKLLIEANREVSGHRRWNTLLAGLRFTRGSFPPIARYFIDVCPTLARFLVIAREFQLGADILSRTGGPSWDAIGESAAIAVIRTALNYSLESRHAGGAGGSSFELGARISPCRIDIGQPGGLNIMPGN